MKLSRTQVRCQCDGHSKSLTAVSPTEKTLHLGSISVSAPVIARNTVPLCSTQTDHFRAVSVRGAVPSLLRTPAELTAPVLLIGSIGGRDGQSVPPRSVTGRHGDGRRDSMSPDDAPVRGHQLRPVPHRQSIRPFRSRALQAARRLLNYSGP